MARKTSSKAVPATDKQPAGGVSTRLLHPELDKEDLTALWTAAHELLFVAVEEPMTHAMPGETEEEDRQHVENAILYVETSMHLLRMARSILYGERP